MKKTLQCDLCKNKRCRNGKDCFGLKDDSLQKYAGDSLNQARVASGIEAEFYMQKTRLEELILFAQRMSCKKIGIAFCIGLSEEARILSECLRKDFEVASVCCKVCGIDKNRLDLDRMHPDAHESMCNPIGQAMLLNREDTDLNVLCGLCIGHDILFARHSEAPVTTFIVKDRILAHNTAGSLYSGYMRKRIS